MVNRWSWEGGDPVPIFFLKEICLVHFFISESVSQLKHSHCGIQYPLHGTFGSILQI